MNVLSLFDGMSCGMLALDRAGITVDNYFASEIDKHAMKVSNHNYPQIKQLGSVIDLTEEQLLALPKIDLLIGGSPCFTEEAMVITSNGYKSIKDISVGDMVLTHTNSFKEVLRVGGKTSDTVIVKAQGFKPTETTANHPYYVRSMTRKYINGKMTRVFSEPKWVNAGDLKTDDFLGTHINKEDSNELNLTDEECYILGRYIADGHTRKDYKNRNNGNSRHWQLILSVGSTKLSDFDRIVDTHFSCYQHTPGVHRVVFSNKRLVEIAEKYCGTSAESKVIPQIFLNLPRILLKSVLNGYLDGDGSYRNNTFRATSVSELLIMSISQAVAKVYRVNSSYGYTKRDKTHIIQGRVVNQKDTYTTEFRTEFKKQSNAIEIDGIIWTRFKSVEPTNRSTSVYNIEVKDDNSYTVNNSIVHNCQGFSIAGRKKGSTTKCGHEVTTLNQYLTLKEMGFEFDGQSYLFWEYKRIQSIVKPKYFFLENVRISPKWEPMFNIAMGCEPTKIDSALFTAQDRVRYYWTNIEFDHNFVDSGVVLGDIALNPDEVDPKYWYKESHVYNGDDSKIQATLGVNGHDILKRVYNLNNKCGTLTCCRGGHQQKKVYQDGRCRKLTPLEYERLQSVPDNYTNCVSDSQRYNMLGNGWTVDVITHIFKGLPQ